MTSSPSLDAAAERLRALGINRIESFAWRDLDDPEGGGSELHADEIFRRWAEHGIGIVHRTSVATGPRDYERHGYRVVHSGGRFDVFARVIVSQLWRRVLRRRRADTATVEIWNGVPWFGPLWAPTRRVVWLHHVHRSMWDDALPRPFNVLGRFLETRFAPLFYRSSQFATLSDSSAAEIRELGISDDNLVVIPPGVHERFTPDEGRRWPTPRIVVVGRLSFVKRQHLALAALQRVRDEHPDLIVDLVGDGPDRAAIDAWVDEHDARDWVNVLGRVSDDELLDAYRRAWLVVSTSHAEGWGMSLTEGGACGTPSVATDIAGHRGAAIDGVTGILVPDDDRLIESMGAEVATLLGNRERQTKLAAAAIEHASSLSWTVVATHHLDVICDRIESERR